MSSTSITLDMYTRKCSASFQSDHLLLSLFVRFTLLRHGHGLPFLRDIYNAGLQCGSKNSYCDTFCCWHSVFGWCVFSRTNIIPLSMESEPVSSMNTQFLAQLWSSLVFEFFPSQFEHLVNVSRSWYFFKVY
jgi:hypothetical protein